MKRSMKKRRKSTWIVKRATNIPIMPMSVAIFSNFSWSGVVSIYCSSFPIILPTQLYLPTTMQTNQPSPVAIWVPDKRTGEGRSWGVLLFDLRYSYSASFSTYLALQLSIVSFLRLSDSPVIADSLASTPELRIMIPSTGTFIPARILQISPTLILLWWMVSSLPFLIAIIYKIKFNSLFAHKLSLRKEIRKNKKKRILLYCPCHSRLEGEGTAFLSASHWMNQLRPRWILPWRWQSPQSMLFFNIK